LPAFLPHLSFFIGRKIFDAAIAASKILFGRKNEIGDKPDNQTKQVIFS
jgi:hypothetical protein